MSIDLAKPLVPSMGNLDPYDGFVTYSLMKEAAKLLGWSQQEADAMLQKEIQDMWEMVQARFQR